MAVKYFKYPFAVAGDKIAVPNTDPGGQVVNYSEGWTVKYTQDPATVGYDVNREQTNQQFFDVTSALQQYQQNGIPDFITSVDNDPDGPYPYDFNALVRYDDGINGTRIYKSLVASNINLPSVSASWQLQPQFISGTDTGATNVLELNTSAIYQLFLSDDRVQITCANNVTGASTLQVGSAPAAAINTVSDTGALIPTQTGDMVINGVYDFIREGPVWVLMNPASTVNVIQYAQVSFLAASTVIIPNITEVKVSFDGVAVGSRASWWDGVNFRFVPGIIGKFRVNAGVWGSNASTSQSAFINVYVNGAIVGVLGWAPGGDNSFRPSGSRIINLTSITDYVEIFVITGNPAGTTYIGAGSGIQTVNAALTNIFEMEYLGN